MSVNPRSAIARLRSMTQEWRLAVHEGSLAMPLILLLVPVVVVLWVYFGRDAHAMPLLTPLVRDWDVDVLAAVHEYIVALLLFFVVPAIAGIIFLGYDPADLGLRAGDSRLGVRLVAILLPIALVVAYMGSFNPELQAEYPLAKSAAFVPLSFLAVEAVYMAFYFAWEFLFRGFMLFGLEREWGPVAAVLIQTMASTIAHIGKPFPEIVAALLAGIVLGYVAVRTRSMVYGLVMHAVVGIALDVFILWHIT